MQKKILREITPRILCVNKCKFSMGIIAKPFYRKYTWLIEEIHDRVLGLKNKNDPKCSFKTQKIILLVV